MTTDKTWRRGNAFVTVFVFLSIGDGGVTSSTAASSTEKHWRSTDQALFSSSNLPVFCDPSWVKAIIKMLLGRRSRRTRSGAPCPWRTRCRRPSSRRWKSSRRLSMLQLNGLEVCYCLFVIFNFHLISYHRNYRGEEPWPFVPVLPPTVQASANYWWVLQRRHGLLSWGQWAVQTWPVCFCPFYISVQLISSFITEKSTLKLSKS